MVVLLVCLGLVLVALAVLLVLLAGLAGRAGRLTDRLAHTRVRAEALERALAQLPAGRPRAAKRP